MEKWFADFLRWAADFIEEGWNLSPGDKRLGDFPKFLIIWAVAIFISFVLCSISKGFAILMLIILLLSSMVVGLIFLPLASMYLSQNVKTEIRKRDEEAHDENSDS